MATMIDNARGAAAYGTKNHRFQRVADRGAAVFTRQTYVPEWDACIAQMRRFRSYEENWDGEGSPPPGPELTDAAISRAQLLQRNGEHAPDRVVVSVNGTIYFEWYTPSGYRELEMVSPDQFEERLIPLDF